MESKNRFTQIVHELVDTLDTPGGMLLVCIAIMISGHVMGEREWTTLGVGALLTLMRGAQKNFQTQPKQSTKKPTPKP